MKISKTVNHENKLKKANDYIKENGVNVQATNSRLKMHFMTPLGWMNDPNGLVFYQGEYHLFFQFYPYDVEWGPMHWGHAKSHDGIKWEYLPIALAPSEEYDYSNIERGHGCFSGSAISVENKLVVMYTGNVDGRTPRQTQNIAFSEDGRSFTKYSNNPVIDAFPVEATEDFRDPKIWKKDELYYAVIGTKKDGKGKAAIYSSPNLKDWDYRGIAAESNGKQGDMWECPDLFTLNQQDILIISPMYGTKNSNPYYLLGDFDYETCRFEQSEFFTLDYGKDFYAPQTFTDDKNRRIMIGWMNMWFTEMPEKKDGWAGAMTIARELTFKNNKLYQSPIAELNDYRVDSEYMENIQVNSESNFNISLANASDILLIVDIENSKAESFDIFVKCSEDMKEKTNLHFDLKQMNITVDREFFGQGDTDDSIAPLSVNNGKLFIRLILDTNALELFINEGEYTLTSRIYPKNRDELFIIKSEELLQVERLENHSLKMEG
ncbi:glycoside hydrolase family 32 protein [Enterococcus dongliensis]|uniref:glycoside hydrolase family 32 protein n=1 Tax=Enterococcus dongliensis TaxID=2559925 RepID=UPI00288ECD2E|nr:glycoside hydrolase family 32 protein [Enterococcus dongliensis]MDT2674916.1 glycoside hydrolase family 32 protein [Enterococcus dongliensis]